MTPESQHPESPEVPDVPAQALGPDPEAVDHPHGSDGPVESIQEVAPLPTRRRGWQFRLLSISIALFCLELGAFLIIFPWMDTWNLNYFSGLSMWMQDVWDAPYFRGAVSGLGLLNVYVALLHIRNLFRY